MFGFLGVLFFVYFLEPYYKKFIGDSFYINMAVLVAVFFFPYLIRAFYRLIKFNSIRRSYNAKWDQLGKSEKAEILFAVQGKKLQVMQESREELVEEVSNEGKDDIAAGLDFGLYLSESDVVKSCPNFDQMSGTELDNHFAKILDEQIKLDSTEFVEEWLNKIFSDTKKLASLVRRRI